MRRFLLVLPLLLKSAVFAQLPQITVTGIYPAGAQRGTSLDVAVTAGTNLDDATELIFSHPGLSAIAKLDATGNPIPNHFSVSVDPAVEPGLYDVRARGVFGISNPRLFQVDTLPEMLETEPNNTDENSQTVSVNTIINGRSNAAADVDTYSFAVAENQTVVIRSTAASLDSLMQPVLELYASNGRRIAHARRRQQREAVIVYTSDLAQILTLKLHDTVYAGGNAYPYRISIDTRPQVDFVQPAILQPGVPTNVTLFGRNIPDGQPTGQTLDQSPLVSKTVSVTIPRTEDRSVGTDSASASVDTSIYSKIEGNLLTFVLADQSPHLLEESPLQTQGDVQSIAIPGIVSGSFATEMDEDTYRFAAKKDEQWMIDVVADRLGSTVAPLLIVEQIIKDAEGKETFKRLAREEANRQNPGGNSLPTLTRDPSFQLNVPADGDYQVRLKDRYAASRGSADMTYSLVITQPKRDFRVVAFDALRSTDGKAPPATGSISLRKGGTYQIMVYAYRYGGHDDQIRIEAVDLPKGVRLSESTIRQGKASAVVVFAATADVKELTTPIRLIASCGEGDDRIDHEVKVTTLVHGGANGLPRTGRVSSSLLLSVMKDEQPVSIEPKILAASVCQGQQLLIPVEVARRAGFDDKVSLVFAGQPANTDVPKVTIEKGSDKTLARFYFKDNAALGPSTLMVYATAQVPYRRKPWLLDEARAAVTDAKAKIEVEKKVAAESQVKVESSQKQVLKLTDALKAYEAEMANSTAQQTRLKGQLKSAILVNPNVTKHLKEVNKNLQAKAAGQAGKEQNLEAAIQAIKDRTSEVRTATKPIEEMLKRVDLLTKQINDQQKQIDSKRNQIAATKEVIAVQQKLKTAAVRQVQETMQKLESLTKSLGLVEAAAKKVETDTKPKNVNTRTLGLPIQLMVHPAPGKLTASVPAAGVIKKGSSVDVKVTLTRKNKFNGPVEVRLLLVDGESRLVSNSATIAAGKTEAMVKLTANADAKAGDIAHAVIRATADFGGRKSDFDAPMALKIVD